MIGPPHVYYRFEDYAVSNGSDEYGDPYPGHTVAVRLQTYRVEKITPCGVRLCSGKFVNSSWNKQFAWPTIEEAKKSFYARKARLISIASARIRDAKMAVNLVEQNVSHEYQLHYRDPMRIVA
jgi:hypothetical protein